VDYPSSWERFVEELTRKPLYMVVIREAFA